MSYYRGPGAGGGGGVSIGFPPVTPMMKRLLIALGVAFVIQQFFELSGAGRFVIDWLALSVPGLLSRFTIWALLTYGLLHGGLMHLLLNMLGLWMFGGDVERTLGSRRFLEYFAICVFGGGLAFVVFGLLTGGTNPVVGASGGVLGLVVAFAFFFPDRPVFVFPIPFPLKAKWLALFFAALNLFQAAQAVAQPGVQFVVAFSAHLGGMGVGYLYLKGLLRPDRWRRSFEQWRAERRVRRFRVIQGKKRGRDESENGRSGPSRFG